MNWYLNHNNLHRETAKCRFDVDGLLMVGRDQRMTPSIPQ
jgi:hypothetical protein